MTHLQLHRLWIMGACVIRGFHFKSQPSDKHTTLMACSSPQPSHEPPHQVQAPHHTDRVSG